MVKQYATIPIALCDLRSVRTVRTATGDTNYQLPSLKFNLNGLPAHAGIATNWFNITVATTLDRLSVYIENLLIFPYTENSPAYATAASNHIEESRTPIAVIDFLGQKLPLKKWEFVASAQELTNGLPAENEHAGSLLETFILAGFERYKHNLIPPFGHTIPYEANTKASQDMPVSRTAASLESVIYASNPTSSSGSVVLSS